MELLHPVLTFSSTAITFHSSALIREKIKDKLLIFHKFFHLLYLENSLFQHFSALKDGAIALALGVMIEPSIS